MCYSRQEGDYPAKGYAVGQEVEGGEGLSGESDLTTTLWRPFSRPLYACDIIHYFGSPERSNYILSPARPSTFDFALYTSIDRTTTSLSPAFFFINLFRSSPVTAPDHTLTSRWTLIKSTTRTFSRGQTRSAEHHRKSRQGRFLKTFATRGTPVVLFNTFATVFHRYLNPTLSFSFGERRPLIVSIRTRLQRCISTLFFFTFG